METLREYWSRPNAALFVMLDPAAGPLSKVNILLRENGIRPRVDKIMKKASKGAVFEINAVFTPGPIMTQDFWNASTLLEGQSTSLKVEEGDERLAIQRINPFPLLEAGHEYYGETKPQQAPAKYDVGEDYDSPLAVAAGVERGNANDVTHAKQTSRLSVITNMEMINPQKVRPDQRDFIKAVLFWLTDREKLGGIGSRNDLTVKIPWDERTKSIVELLAVIALPLLALFMAFLLWRSRRS